MSERAFRLIQGVYILIALYFELDMMLYVYIGIIAFEGIFNLRVPVLVSHLRYGLGKVDILSSSGEYKFEAERMLRLVVTFLFVITFILYPEPTWFFPWFIGVMLFLAGLTKICPMVMFFRYLGFR